MPAALLLGTGTMWGPLAAALGVTQALLAIIILEDVNYIEHYGLQRALTRTGRHVTASRNLCMCREYGGGLLRSYAHPMHAMVLICNSNYSPVSRLTPSVRCWDFNGNYALAVSCGAVRT